MTTKNIDFKESEAKGINLKSANLLSVAMIIISLALLIVFFIFSSGKASAQDSSGFTSSNGNDDIGQGGLEFIFLALGIDALVAEDFEQAHSDFETSLDENPEFVPTIAAYGLLYLAEEETELALEYALLALEMDEESAEAYYVLGVIYYEMGELSTAIVHFEQFLEILTIRENEPAMLQRMFKDDENEMTSILYATGQIIAATERLNAIGG